MKTFLRVLSAVLLLSLPLLGSDEDLRLKWKQFKSDFEGNCSIVWNSRTGGAKRIIGSSIFLDSGSIDEQNIANFADSFIRRYAELLNVKGSEAKLAEITAANGKYSVVYQQYYQNIPVWNAQLRLRVNSKGQVLFIGSDFYKIPDISVNPSINLQTAINTAKSALSINTDCASEGGTLVIYPNIDASILLLSWNFRLLSEEHGMDKEIFIDAHNNKILLVFDAYVNWEIFGTVQTKAWQVDDASNPSPPTDPDLTVASTDLNVTIQDVGTDVTDQEGDYSITVPNNTTYTVSSSMTGPRAYVVNDVGSEASHSATASPSAAHDWTWSESAHYNEYNVFYYMNKAWQYFSGVNGFNSNYWYNHAMQGIANFGSGIDGWANGTNIKVTPDGCKYAGLVYHEFAHNVLFRARGGFIGYPAEYTDGYALDEGLADYYSCSFKNDPKWCYASVRWLNNKLKYSPPPSGPPYDEEDKAHYRGQIIGGACWDLRGYIGTDIVDDLVYDVVDNYTGWLDTFGNFMDDIFLSDDDNGNIYDGTPHDDEIFDAFNDDHYVLGTIVSGTIHRNMIWDDDITVLGDITVAAGITLEIEPDVTVTFAPMDAEAGGITSSKSEIIVNGTLMADGATFTASSKGAWYGIRFESTASNTSYLDDCTIENATVGVVVNASDPTIEDCNIKTCDDWGIYVYGSGAWPIVTDNYIESDLVDVYNYNCGTDGGAYSFNSFRTAGTGVYTVSGQADFINNESGTAGHNKWESSILGNRALVGGGLPYFGDDEVGGWNYFTKPSSSTYKYIKNTTGNTIYAISNYFDACPNPDTDWFYGSVDRSMKLTNPPSNPAAGPTWSLPKGSTTFFARLRAAKSAALAGDKSNARDELVALTAEYKETELAAYSLDLLLGISTPEDSASNVLLADSLVLDEKVPLNVKFIVDKWTVINDSKRGELLSGQSMLERYKGSVFDNEMTTVFATALAGNRQKEQATRLVKEAFQNENDSPEILESLIKSIELQEFYDQSGSFEKPPLGSDEKNVNFVAYPNPFNASTKLAFELEDAVHVSLVVYNTVGQKIRTLLDATLQTGQHEAIWDGRDDFGQAASTGIYLCRLLATGRRQTVKIIMVK